MDENLSTVVDKFFKEEVLLEGELLNTVGCGY